MVGKVQKSYGTRPGLYGGLSNEVPPIHFLQAEHRIQFRSRPMKFLGFSNHKKGAPRQEISKSSTLCSTFSRSGWSVVRSASLAKGDTKKMRPSTHLHKVPTQSNKASPRNLQTDFVYSADCHSSPSTNQLSNKHHRWSHIATGSQSVRLGFEPHRDTGVTNRKPTKKLTKGGG
jgi:hypothetical protein